MAFRTPTFSRRVNNIIYYGMFGNLNVVRIVNPQKCISAKLGIGSVFVPCRTDNIVFGEMIIADICSEISFDDTLCFLLFFVKSP
jgi:hypothetical protein